MSGPGPGPGKRNWSQKNFYSGPWHAIRTQKSTRTAKFWDWTRKYLPEIRMRNLGPEKGIRKWTRTRNSGPEKEPRKWIQAWNPDRTRKKDHDLEKFWEWTWTKNRKLGFWTRVDWCPVTHHTKSSNFLSIYFRDFIWRHKDLDCKISVGSRMPGPGKGIGLAKFLKVNPDPKSGPRKRTRTTKFWDWTHKYLPKIRTRNPGPRKRNPKVDPGPDP